MASPTEYNPLFMRETSSLLPLSPSGRSFDLPADYDRGPPAPRQQEPVSPSVKERVLETLKKAGAFIGKGVAYLLGAIFMAGGFALSIGGIVAGALLGAGVIAASLGVGVGPAIGFAYAGGALGGILALALSYPAYKLFELGGMSEENLKTAEKLVLYSTGVAGLTLKLIDDVANRRV